MKRLSLLLALLFIINIGKAQQGMTLFQMHEISHSNIVNPAVVPDAKWIFRTPIFGTLSIAASIPISYDNLGTGDFFDTDYLLSKMKDRNNIFFNVDYNLFTLGHRVNKLYFEFSVSEKAEGFASITKDPFNVFLNGNGNYIGQTVDGELSLRAMHYREYAFNVTYEVKDDFWVSARPKLLFGRMGLDGMNNKISLYTDPATYALRLSSDLKINASIPGTPEFDDNDYVESLDTDFTGKDFLFNTSNMGFGLDLGMVRDMDNGFSFSASVLNLGTINWSKNTKEFSQSTSITYDGPTSVIDNWDDLMDTLGTALNLNYNEKDYRHGLSPTVIVGGNYLATDFLRVGLTAMNTFNPKSNLWAVTASAFTENLPVISAGISYTVTRNSFANIGTAIGLRLGAFNIHFITDNILASFAWDKTKHTTFQMGMSFNLGKFNDQNKDARKRDKAVRSSKDNTL